MNGLVHFLNSLFACFVFLGIVVSGLVMMVSPRLGKQLLKNVAIAGGIVILASVCLCAFCSSGYAVLVFLPASVTAYFVRERRLNRHSSPVRQNWAARTPVLPREEDEV